MATRWTASVAILAAAMAARAEEEPSRAEILKAFSAYAALAPEARAGAPRPWERVGRALTAAEAQAWRKDLWGAWVQGVRAAQEKPPKPEEKPAPGEARVRVGPDVLRFTVRAFGQKPKKGWPLYLYLHGGGPSKAGNDAAWAAAQGAQAVQNALYVCPRSPTDAWQDCWGEPLVYGLLDQLLKECYALRGVDPDRVYLMGYSMGGWGAFHFASALADRWAAAGASAGGAYPGRSPPCNLRNTPLIVQIGTRDEGAGSHAKSKAYAEAVAALRKEDPGGYVLELREHKGAGHLIDDSATPAWMGRFARDPVPKRLAWQQRIGHHGHMEDGSEVLMPYGRRFSWLRVEDPGDGQKVTAEREGGTIRLAWEGPDRVTVLLDDRMTDLDRPVRVLRGEEELFHGTVPRTLKALADSLADRGDPELMFSAALTVP